jgi:hypothetical protein
MEGMPKLFGVQSECSAAVANAYFSGSEQIIPLIQPPLLIQSVWTCLEME